MKFKPRGLVVTAMGVLVLWAALTTHEAAAVDSILLIALAIFAVITSAAIVSAKSQGRSVVGQAGAVREIRRWFSNHENS